MQPSIRRVLLAAVVAPLAVVPIVLAFTLLPATFGTESLDSDAWRFVLIIVWIALGVTLAASLVIGIPVFLILARKNVNSLFVCGVVGGLIGLLAGLMLEGTRPIVLAMAVVCGVAVGLAFPIVAGEYTSATTSDKEAA